MLISVSAARVDAVLITDAALVVRQEPNPRGRLDPAEHVYLALVEWSAKPQILWNHRVAMRVDGRWLPIKVSRLHTPQPLRPDLVGHGADRGGLGRRWGGWRKSHRLTHANLPPASVTSYPQHPRTPTEHW